MRALLIRHAHYPLIGRALGGREDHPLSPEGEAQAAALARTLVSRPLAAIVSSPIRRARQTAAAIAAAHHLPLEIDQAFTEIDFAAWTGRTFTSLADDPDWRRWNEERHVAAIPGGETMTAVQTRAAHALARLEARFPQGEIAIVTHGDLIKAIVLRTLTTPLTAIHALDIAPASVTTIDSGRLLTLNHNR